jgi:uncharacterized Zn-binding protein involved in type VI secretion
MRGETIITIGCKSTHNGVVLTGDPTMSICGVPVARIGDLHYCPAYSGDTPHGITPIIQGSCTGTRGLIKQVPLAISTDRTSCGAELLPCILCNPATNSCNS